MEAVIRAIEDADRPSEHLDNEIAEALGWGRREAWDEEVGGYREWISPEGKGWGILASACCPLGRLTSSIDAALKLIPNRNWWSVEKVSDENSPIRNFGAKSALYEAATDHDYGAIGFLGHHNHPAMALCIAALKAVEFVRTNQSSSQVTKP